MSAGPFFVLNMANGNPIIVETNTRQMDGERGLPAGPHLQQRGSLDDRASRARRSTWSRETRALVRDRLLGILFSQSLDVVDARDRHPGRPRPGLRCWPWASAGAPRLWQRAGTRMRSSASWSACDSGTARLPGPGRRAPASPSSSTSSSYILVDQLDDVVVITIRRPAQLNALTDGDTTRSWQFCSSTQDDPGVGGFVITGYGTRAFCAGADIGKFPEMLGDARGLGPVRPRLLPPAGVPGPDDEAGGGGGQRHGAGRRRRAGASLPRPRGHVPCRASSSPR